MVSAGAEAGTWRRSSVSIANGQCAEVGAWRKARVSMANGNCAEIGTWRTASSSAYNGDCAEVGAWRTAQASHANGNCTEVGIGGTVVGVRDSKQAYLGEARTVLEFTPGAWGRFLAQVRQEAGHE